MDEWGHVVRKLKEAMEASTKMQNDLLVYLIAMAIMEAERATGPANNDNRRT